MGTESSAGRRRPAFWQAHVSAPLLLGLLGKASAMRRAGSAPATTTVISDRPFSPAELPFGERDDRDHRPTLGTCSATARCRWSPSASSASPWAWDRSAVRQRQCVDRAAPRPASRFVIRSGVPVLSAAAVRGVPGRVGGGPACRAWAHLLAPDRAGRVDSTGHQCSSTTGISAVAVPAGSESLTTPRRHPRCPTALPRHCRCPVRLLARRVLLGVEFHPSAVISRHDHQGRCPTAPWHTPGLAFLLSAFFPGFCDRGAESKRGGPADVGQ